MLDLARGRVHAFEEEYQKTLEKLTLSEVEMKCAVDLRSRYIINQEKTSALQTKLYQNRVNILEKRFEILRLNLLVDKYILDGSYEELQLQQLIAGTHHRNFENLENVMRAGADQLIHRLQSSVILRQNLLAESKLLLSRLDHLRLEHENSCASIRDRQVILLNQLVNDFTHYTQKSSSLLRKVIEDSLILRHNSRLAAEILAKRRKLGDTKGANLDKLLKQLQIHFENQIQSAEDDYNKECDLKLQLKRIEIMRREGILETVLSQSTNLKLESTEKSDKYLALKRSIDFHYNNLQIRRKNELIRWKMELEKLKHHLLTAESIILNPEASYRST